MKARHSMEFSKVLAVIVTILFAGTVIFLLGAWAFIDKTPAQIQAGTDILGVVATPFGFVATGYYAKAGLENYQKIKKGWGKE